MNLFLSKIKSNNIFIFFYKKIGRDIVFYMEGLGFELQTPHFSTINCVSSRNFFFFYNLNLTD